MITPPTRRRSTPFKHRVLLTVVVPTAALLTVVLGYYTWAVQGATTDPATVSRIHPGMPKRVAGSLLPRRQAPVRLTNPPIPAGADACQYYTDGNFPLGYASWRICFGAKVVLSIDDLR